MADRVAGDLELAVLLTVARLGEGAYGATVRRDLQERTARDYSVGAIHTTLQRLEDKGLVRSRMADPTPVRGGRSRRYITLTAAGAAALRESRRAIDALWAGVNTRWRPT